jgi:hypothetical protein
VQTGKSRIEETAGIDGSSFKAPSAGIQGKRREMMFVNLRGRLSKLCLAAVAALLVAAIFASTGAQAAPSHPFIKSFNGSETPPEEFAPATGIAVDPAGYLYVTSTENSSIFVYDPSHHYLATIEDTEGPYKPAVDSEGNVYAIDFFTGSGAPKAVLFEPNEYPPTAATTYTKSTLLDTEGSAEPKAVAVNPINDHVDVATQTTISEYKSVAEGSDLISATVTGALTFGLVTKNYASIGIGATGNIYIALKGSTALAEDRQLIVITSPDGTTVLHEFENTTRPFEALGVNSAVVDQATGNVFVAQTNEVSGAAVIEEFTEDGTLVSEIGPTFNGSKTFEGAFPEPGLAIDNSSTASAGRVYVGSGFSNSVINEFGPLAELFALTVAKSGSGVGTVSGGSPADPTGIGCGSVCTHEFASGDVVTLTATPAVGSEFTGWTGACTGAGACVVTISEAKAVAAAFSAIPPKPVLTVSKSGAGAGTVASAPGGINCGGTCAAAFTSGTSVTLTATPASGSEFKGWTGACSGAGACTVTMSAAKTVGAQFDPAVSPPPPPPPPPPPTCATNPSLCPPAIPTIAKNAAVQGGKAQVKLSCPGPGACSGTLKLSAKLKTGKSKKPKKMVIGQSPFNLSAGVGGTIKVKLSSAAKKALKSGKSLKATVSGTGVPSGTVQLKSSGGK